MNNNKNTKPKILYKYTTIETGLKILETQTIRFSNPKTFNDPYDSDMPIVFENPQGLTKEYFVNLCLELKKHHDIVKFPIYFDLDEAIKVLSNSSKEINVDSNYFIYHSLYKLKKYMKILSLSKNNNNMLMWGHYAKNHTGMVIGFNTNCMFFRQATEMKYSKKIPKLKNIIVEDLLLQKYETFEEFKKIFVTKSYDWKYEEEYRCVFDVNRNLEFLSSIPNAEELYPNLFQELKNNDDFIHQPFSSECLNSVYLGINSNPKYLHLIMKIIQNKYPHAKLYTAFLSDNNFNVNFERVIDIIK